MRNDRRPARHGKPPAPRHRGSPPPGQPQRASPPPRPAPAPLVQRFALREGLLVEGPTGAADRGSGPRLLGVEHIEGRAPNHFPRRNFDELTPIDPTKQVVLETGRE